MTLRISAARNERGVALPLALLALVMLSGLLLAFLAMSAHDPQIAQNHVSSSKAFHIADSGIEHAWAVLPSTNLTTLNAGQSLNPFSAQAFGGGSYGVTVTKNADGTYTVTSTGTYKDSTQTVAMVVQATPAGPGLPAFSAAVSSVSNGSDETDYETGSLGASFVTGNDESPAGTCTGQTNKAGWLHRNATPGTGPGPSFQFDYQGGILEGVGGTGAAAHRAFNAATDDPRFNDPVALRAWVSSLAAQPGVVNVDLRTSMTGHPTTLGTAASPQITVWDMDDATVQHSTNAAVTGYGILILKGPNVHNGHFGGYHWFNVQKAFNFHGLIIVDSGGEVSFTHYANPPDVVIHGAIVAVSVDSGEESTKLDFEKNTQVYYNCAALRDYAQPLAGSGGSSSFTRLSWKQQ